MTRTTTWTAAVPADTAGPARPAGPDGTAGAAAGAATRVAAGRAEDTGISTIEVVLLAPLLMVFILLLVGFGQLVDARGELDGAARDAARAGSLHGRQGDADTAAEQAAKDDLGSICVDGTVTITHNDTDWAPGGVYTVQLTCRVRGLAKVGLGLPTTLHSQFASPLDPYRRYE